MGVVTEKNILLTTSTTEKMAATRHANGKDVWVAMHEWNSNRFRTYLITLNGIQLNYTKSEVGTTLPIDQTEFGPGDAIGQMKFSANGERLALVTYISRLVEVFDFDLLTGKLSVFFSFSNYLPPGRPYGLEFSPSGRYLYFTVRQCDILQLDLESQSIANSLQVINDPAPCFNSAQLQLGPDGKIYVAQLGTKVIGVINIPNESGKLSNYNSQGILIPLGGVNSCSASLPNFISGYFYRDPELYPQSPYFEMPNVFTPNNDCVNDRFEPMSNYNVNSLI